MLVITIELWPHGNEKEKKHLGTAWIVNNLKGTLESGDYVVELSKWGRPNEKWKTGHLVGFPRLKLGPWDLLYRALEEVVGRRNRP